jgi:hypothetical protein
MLALAAVLATGTRAQADPKYFPANTELVVTVNVRQAIASEVLKDKQALAKGLLKDALQKDEQAQQYFKELGFDPFRDLERVTAVFPASVDPAQGLFIIHGKIDPKKFEDVAAKAAKDHGDVVKISRSGGKQIIAITPPGKDETTYLCLVSGKELLASQSKTVLNGALAQAGADGPAELNQAMKNLMPRLDKKASFNFLATAPALVKLAEKNNDPKTRKMAQPFIDKVAGFSGKVTLVSDIQFEIGVSTKEADEAKQFAQTAPFMLGVAKGIVAKMAKKDERLAPAVDVVNSLRVSAKGDTIFVNGRMSAEAAERLIKEAMKLHPAGGSE